MPSLEITTMVGCPMKCTFCPQDQLRAQYGKDPDKYMSLDNFKLILSKIPTYVRIDFSGMAEPWTNEACTDMLQHALGRGHHVAIYTTLYGVSAAEAQRIFDLVLKHKDQVETVCLHLPDDNGNMRGWRYSLQYELALRTMMQLADTVLDFRAMTMDRSGAVHKRLRMTATTLDGWVGMSRAGALDMKAIGEQPIEATPSHETLVSCSYTPFYDQNVVLPNGDVVLCCMDYEMKHVIGNLITGDYWSLFGSPAMVALQVENRKCGNSGTSICKSCVRASRYAVGGRDHLNWTQANDDGAMA
jgi:Iron-sulfur cluster-binding domain